VSASRVWRPPRDAGEAPRVVAAESLVKPGPDDVEAVVTSIQRGRT